MKFCKRPDYRHAPPTFHAARYQAGQPLGDMRSVAEWVWGDVAMAEVPQLGVLVIRYRVCRDDTPPGDYDFEVVPDGDWLLEATWGGAYTLTDDAFRGGYQPAPPEPVPVPPKPYQPPTITIDRPDGASLRLLLGLPDTATDDDVADAAKHRAEQTRRL